ncbi:MAG: toll/interleukin-1 receptor domain-containing protein [Chitinophagales bacterium]|nr:toll/interleukin-1 receptor domain-containing protein [Chitinophagales bacterium]
MATPKIFISYSWQPIENKDKVLELATRLQLDGVHVIIDEWDLAEGHDKYSFMEQMVNSSEVNRVLLICNKEYKQKADKKAGGVGIESLIISDEIYSKVDQNKFIPIVFERDESQKEYLPTFVKTRIYIDLSSSDYYEDQYEKLLRNIFDKPANRRPTLGTPPSYLVEEIESPLLTAHKVATIKNALINEKRNSHLLINDYYEAFLKSLETYRFSELDFEIPNKIQIDEIILQKLEIMRPLRNDYLEFLETITTFSPQFDFEKFHDFWQGIIQFVVDDDSFTHGNRTQIGHLIFDHFRFFIRELFLHQTALLIKKQRFDIVNFITNHPFIIVSSKQPEAKVFSYEIIRSYIESLNIRNERLRLNRASLTGDLLKERTSDSVCNFDAIQEADLILYYVSMFNEEINNRYRRFYWYPESIVSRYAPFALFEKMISKRFFEKTLILWSVKNIEELKMKIEKAKGDDFKLQRGFNDIPYIEQLFNFKKIATVP